MNVAVVVGKILQMESGISEKGVAWTRLVLSVARETPRRYGGKPWDAIGIRVGGRLSETAQKWLGVGDVVGVLGQSQCQRYVDKEGVTRYQNYIWGDRLHFISLGRDKDGNPREVGPFGVAGTGRTDIEAVADNPGRDLETIEADSEAIVPEA